MAPSAHTTRTTPVRKAAGTSRSPPSGPRRRVEIGAYLHRRGLLPARAAESFGPHRDRPGPPGASRSARSSCSTSFAPSSVMRAAPTSRALRVHDVVLAFERRHVALVADRAREVFGRSLEIRLGRGGGFRRRPRRTTAGRMRRGRRAHPPPAIPPCRCSTSSVIPASSSPSMNRSAWPAWGSGCGASVAAVGLIVNELAHVDDLVGGRRIRVVDTFDRRRSRWCRTSCRRRRDRRPRALRRRHARARRLLGAGVAGSPALTATCSSLGTSRAPAEAGSSQSTSLMGAKNLSRSSKRSSPSRLSSATRPP